MNEEIAYPSPAIEDICPNLKGWDMPIFVGLALLAGYLLGSFLK